MLKVYDNLRADNRGSITPGRTKLFIESYDESGEVLLSKSGTLLTPEGTGAMFIVDDWLIPQLGKVKFLDGVLSVKDGEELVPPVKTEKELQIEAIERQLAALKAEPDEPVDATEQLLLENTEPPE